MMESLIFLSKFIRPHIRENWQTQLQAFIYQISFAKNLRPTILLSFLKRNFHKNACQCYHQKGTNSISYQYIVTTAILLLISTFLFVLTQPPNCHLRSLFCLPKDCFHQQHRRPRSKRAHQCHIHCEVLRQEREQSRFTLSVYIFRWQKKLATSNLPFQPFEGFIRS